MRSQHEIGNQHFSEQNFKQALACYQAEVELNPRNEKSWKNQATCYRRLNDNYAAFFAAVEAFNINPDYEAALFEIGTALKNISTAESAQYIACVAQFYWDSFKKPIGNQTKELFKNLLAHYIHVELHDPLIQGLLWLAVIHAEKKEVIYERFLQLIRNHTKEEHSAIEHRFDYKVLQKICELCRNYYQNSAFKEIFPLMTMGELIGMPDVCALLADCYENGLGCKVDFQRAMSLYEKAAEHKSASAYMKAGSFYINEKNPFKDESKAFAYFLLAAEQQEAMAHLPLARMYMDGLGTEQNLEKAFNHFEMAATHDFEFKTGEYKANAQYHLALCYYEGLFVPKDYGKARKLLLQSARFVDASWYVLGLITVEKNNLEAQKLTLLYLQKGIEKGCPYAKNLHLLIIKTSFEKFLDFLSLFDKPLVKTRIRTPKKTESPQLSSAPAESEGEILSEKLPAIAPNKLSQPQNKPQKKKNNKKKDRYVVKEKKDAVEVKKFIPQIEDDEPPVDTTDTETDNLFSKAQTHCFELIKNKNINDFREVFETLILYSKNAQTTVVQFRVYDFFLHTLLQILSKEINAIQSGISKRLLHINRPNAKSLTKILESLKFTEALNLFFLEKLSEYSTLIHGNIGKKLSSNELDEIKKAVDDINVDCQQVRLNLTDTKLAFIEMDRKIKENKEAKFIQLAIEKEGKNAANLTRAQLLEIGISLAKQLKKQKPGEHQREKILISQGLSLLAKMDELDISPKVILKKIPLGEEEARAFSFLKLSTNLVIFGGSSILKKLLEDPSFGCEVKINTEAMGKDYDYYSLDPQKEKLIRAAIHPSFDVKNLYSFQGTESLKFSKTLQLYFFENAVGNSYATLIKSLQGICTIDTIGQDEYGNIFGTKQAFADLKQGKLSLNDKNPEQFNQDSVRILHLIKKIALGYKPDENVESNLEKWVKTGNISNLNHFKAILRAELSTENKNYVHSYLNTLHKYLVITKLFKDEKNVWTVSQLQELLKPKLVAQEQRLFKDSAPSSESLNSPTEGIRPE